MANKYEKKLAKMLNDSDIDIEEIEEYIEEHEDDYDEDLWELAFRVAVREGNLEYVEAHIDDIELNDEGDCSSYLNETEDEEMIELLMDNGAFRSWEDYSDCRFACETVNDSILAFDPEFQTEVYERYKEERDITDEDVVRILETLESEEELEEEEDEIAQELEQIGVSVSDGEIVFEDKTDQLGSELKDILEFLGWECDFEGDDWKLETAGVYFIR